MSLSNIFGKNKGKSSRSRKNKEGSSSAGPESGPYGGSGSDTSGSQVIIVWDLGTCGIPQNYSLDGVLDNIPKAIGSPVAGSYIFCADPLLRGSMSTHSNQVISEFSPGVFDIAQFAETYTWPVLVITGDTTFCEFISLLRHRNIIVGVACLEDHPIMLKYVACYALDWNKIALGRVGNTLVGSRSLQITPPAHCNINPIYIYWDIESCMIQEPNETEMSMAKLTERFQRILRSHNYWGHLHFFVYANVPLMETMHHQAIYANSMLLKTVQDPRVNGSKILLDDLLDMLYRCDRPSCFMIVNNEDVRSGEKMIIKRKHDLIVVRPPASRWPDYSNYAKFKKLEWPVDLQE